MIMEELKERTKELHAEVERKVDLLHRLDSVEKYGQLLSRFFGFYSPLEDRIAFLAKSHSIELDLTTRKKAPLLRKDLQDIGWSTAQIDEIPICGYLPQVNNVAKSYGCLYVLEGATLGGQIIRREVADRLGLNAQNGCEFFTGYGERTMQAWREFGNAVNSFAHDHPSTKEEIVAAASESFRRFGEWLA